MDENKNELIESINTESLSVAPLEEAIDLTSYTQFSLERIASLGTSFEPFAAAVQHIVSGGQAKSGLYMVTVKPETHLAAFKDGSGFMGGLLDKSNRVGAGQARLNPLIFDPATVCMTLTLMSIEKKLDVIQKTQLEILAYLKSITRAEILSNYEYLSSILNELKFKWDDKLFRDTVYIKAMDSRREALRSISLAKSQIESNFTRQGAFIEDKYFKDEIVELRQNLQNYQCGVYVYSMARFLEVLLSGDYRTDYLQTVKDDILAKDRQYEELRKKCCIRCKELIKKSRNSILKKTGIVIEKLGELIVLKDIASALDIDDAAERWKQIDMVIESKLLIPILSTEKSGIEPFEDAISSIQRLYNEQTEFVIDKENIYLPDDQ